MSLFTTIGGIFKSVLRGGSVLSFGPKSLARGVVRTVVRGLAQSFGKVGATLGDLDKMLEGLGAKDVKVVFGQDKETLLAKARYTDVLRNWSDTRLLDRGLMVETSLPQGKKYRVFYEVTLLDPNTGRQWSEQKSFYTEDLETFDTWRDEIYDKMMGSVYDTKLEVQGIGIISVFHDKGSQY